MHDHEQCMAASGPSAKFWPIHNALEPTAYFPRNRFLIKNPIRGKLTQSRAGSDRHTQNGLNAHLWTHFLADNHALRLPQVQHGLGCDLVAFIEEHAGFCASGDDVQLLELRAQQPMLL